MHAFSPFWRVIMILPCYIHGIYIFGIIYRPWKWHFWSYILFARSRIQNWRKNGLIWRKIQKKKNFMEVMVFVFSKSGGDPMLGSDRLSYRCGKEPVGWGLSHQDYYTNNVWHLCKLYFFYLMLHIVFDVVHCMIHLHDTLHDAP